MLWNWCQELETLKFSACLVHIHIAFLVVSVILCTLLNFDVCD